MSVCNTVRITAAFSRSVVYRGESDVAKPGLPEHVDPPRYNLVKPCEPGTKFMADMILRSQRPQPVLPMLYPNAMPEVPVLAARSAQRPEVSSRTVSAAKPGELDAS